ncbi:SAM-dependent methyltransferase, partial [Campylobacter jejuni]|nr:SAM-dependent methyltransferase [Campylobacter jejuni]EAH4560315.1 SAM-dependent methyltransferase [Campylobacter jejuni]EAH4650790.1 SAM-dependent methyltransferase [Campylobacter jejuni]EAH4706773.1 SAM-dependent methyltransferase [Campylobacter jejuni]EAH4764781.1 SAM-dependent methyltransferase [Campylobacter jejuni]
MKKYISNIEISTNQGTNAQIWENIFS